MALPRLERGEVLRARAARQGLGATRDVEAVLALGIQDTPYGSARQALVTRLGRTDEVAADLVWSWRGAPHLHRPGDLRSLAPALWPYDDADATARVGTQIRQGSRRGVSAFTAVAEAFRACVGVRMPKGEVSAAVTAAIPEDLSYDCRACAARHVSGDLFQLAGLAGGVRVVVDARKTLLEPIPAAHRPELPTAAVGIGDRMSRYLDVLGPASPSHLGRFLGSTARVVMADRPADWVQVDGPRGKAWATPGFLDSVGAAPAGDGLDLHLLPPGDPWLQARDRDLIVPDKARQKALWRILGSPGAVLAGVEIIGSWRASTKRARLEVTVDLFDRAPAGFTEAVEVEARVMAAGRGLPDASVTRVGA